MRYEINTTTPINSWYYHSVDKQIINVDNINLTTGLFEKGADKRYTQEQWTKAFHNGLYLTQVMSDAETNKYDEVIFPKGETIMLCYSNYADISDNIKPTACIHVESSNLIIDMNGCKIIMMLDSDIMQPYYQLHPKTSQKPHNIWGAVFSFEMCKNVTLQNGELCGDVYFRSFADASEYLQEQTYGVLLRYGAENITVKDMDIHGFMGDCIGGNDRSAILRTGRYETSVRCGAGILNRGSLSNNGDIDTSIKTSFLSDLITIDWTQFYPANIKYKNEGKLIFCTNQKDTGINFKALYGQDSSIYTNVPHTDYPYVKIFFFDTSKSNTVPTRSVIVNLQDVVLVNKNEDAIKYQITKQTSFIDDPTYGELLDADGLPLTYRDCRMGLLPHNGGNHIIDSCKIHDGHRGGISNLVINSTVRFCEIYRNGMDSGIGAPTFGGDTATRYAINNEEVIQRGIVIENNNIYNNHYSFLNHSITVTVRDNVFINNKNIIVIYGMCERVDLYNNNIYNCDDVFVYRGYEFINENKSKEFLGGHLRITDFLFKNNTIKCDVGKMLISDGHRFHVDISSNKVSTKEPPYIKVQKNVINGNVALLNNTFDNEIGLTILENVCLIGNIFRINSRITNNTNKTLLGIDNFSRDNKFIGGFIYILKSALNLFDGFVFENTTLDFTEEKNSLLLFKNVSFTNTLFHTYYTNATTTRYDFNNCVFRIDNTSILGSDKIVLSPRLWDNDYFIFRNCEFDISDQAVTCFGDFRKNYNGTPSYTGNNFMRVIDCTSSNFDLKKLFDPTGGGVLNP